jgi:hypothetical protein
MEWLTGVALLPALVCGVMMGGMVLMGVLGLRHKQDTSPGGPVAQEAPRDREAGLQ